MSKISSNNGNAYLQNQTDKHAYENLLITHTRFCQQNFHRPHCPSLSAVLPEVHLQVYFNFTCIIIIKSGRSKLSSTISQLQSKSSPETTLKWWLHLSNYLSLASWHAIWNYQKGTLWCLYHVCLTCSSKFAKIAHKNMENDRTRSVMKPRWWNIVLRERGNELYCPKFISWTYLTN